MALLGRSLNRRDPSRRTHSGPSVNAKLPATFSTLAAGEIRLSRAGSIRRTPPTAAGWPSANGIVNPPAIAQTIKFRITPVILNRVESLFNCRLLGRSSAGVPLLALPLFGECIIAPRDVRFIPIRIDGSARWRSRFCVSNTCTEPQLEGAGAVCNPHCTRVYWRTNSDSRSASRVITFLLIRPMDRTGSDHGRMKA